MAADFSEKLAVNVAPAAQISARRPATRSAFPWLPQACSIALRNAVDIECEFICDMLLVALVGMNGVLMNQYIEFVADHLLMSPDAGRCTTRPPYVICSLNGVNAANHVFSIDEDF
ncbi:hypothetical protein HU200_038190 [Digitaria exilis]|uniref:Uncharacterized protein n=1 Tax=Digitaria exilis TaxID=1010633 RepID=A0A835BD70_9POAL|nr:hypothetical protein HU200_038190 [Digitaria exilis]